MKLLQHNEKVTKQRGQSTILYEDPDITSIGDQEILKELNKRVREQPDFILPEGYYKVAEKEQIFKYELPSYIAQGMSISKVVALETLDTFFSEALGFHILEALVSYESRYKVKPRIKHNTSAVASKSQESQQNPGLNFMKPIEKKTFARDLSAAKGNQSASNITNASPKIVLAPLINLENQKLQI